MARSDKLELGWPLPKRKALIEQLKKEPAGPVHPLFFQGEKQQLPIRRVALEFPKYRLDNGRTRSAQAAYLANHPELDPNFFMLDFESEVAQRAQHEILARMLGRSEKNLLKYFDKREQTDPLILTELGFVVNGNRRLCAMRELIREDREQYFKRFGNIDVVFLPPSDDKELDRLEARLQLTEDIKQPYSWTAKAFMLRTRLKEHDFSEDELSSIYEMPVAKIHELLEMLSLAEVYLEDRKKPLQFESVDKSEFAFRQLKVRREKLKNERQKDIFQRLAFCLIDEPAEGRLYATIPELADNIDAVINAITTQISPPKTKPKTKVSQAAALLGVRSVSRDPALDILQDDKNFPKIRELVSDVIDTKKEKDKEVKKGNKSLSRLTKAADLIASALTSWSEIKSRESVAKKVTEIEALVKRLRTKLDANAKH